MDEPDIFFLRTESITMGQFSHVFKRCSLSRYCGIYFRLFPNFQPLKFQIQDISLNVCDKVVEK